MSTTTHTLAEMATALNRPTVVVSGLQDRFELPAFEDTGYSDAYLAFLKTVVHLGTLGIAEDRLLRLWHLEKKLLQFLHVDSDRLQDVVPRLLLARLRAATAASSSATMTSASPSRPTPSSLA